MKVRVYDSKQKDVADRYTLYFPYPKWLRQQEGRPIMGCFQPFNFIEEEKFFTFYAWDYDDRSRGYNIPRTERKIKLETLPKFVRDYVDRMDRLWNDALKYDDDEHWAMWNAA